MINFLIAAMCLKMTDVPNAQKYYTSCINASQAASIQYKIKPIVDGFEERMNKQIARETGEQVWFVAGMGYTYLQKGTVNFNTKIGGIVDNVGIQGSPNGSGNINLTWYW